ncbi:MAG: rhomboid family intramembrane serine protease [Hyphomicrobiales bacterium]|nr:MAG: rhomboid family intramembrane serine protease [Hyphomicrobiales bacterium]
MTHDRDPAGTGHDPTPDSPPHEPARGREPMFNLPAVVVAFIVACVGIHLVRVWLLSPQQDLGLILRFAFFPLRYSGGYTLDVYAFLAPFTYSLLHGGLAHLAVNTIWLAAFGSPLANRIGPLRFLLFWALTSLAAVGLHYVLYKGDAVPLVGASGAISGMMGAAARFGFRIDRREGRAAFAGRILSIPEVFASRTAVTFLVVWFAVNLVMGLGFGAPDDGGSIAWEAHIGGFLAGFLLVRAFDRRPASYS